MVLGTSTLAGLARLRPGVKRARFSSYDRAGGNRDWWEFQPGETKAIAEIEGAGCIKHIWCTMFSNTKHEYRKVVLRMFWDGETQPSIEVPIGDFFGLGHGLAHGGFVFALADSAFAFACNGYNQRTVGHQAAITYMAPGRLGDRLTAVARELHRGRRDGIYDVHVSNDRGEQVAEFRGHSRTVKGTHLPE